MVKLFLRFFGIWSRPSFPLFRDLCNFMFNYTAMPRRFPPSYELSYRRAACSSLRRFTASLAALVISRFSSIVNLRVLFN